MLRKLISSTLIVALTVFLCSTGALAGKPAANQAPTVTGFDVAAESASPVPVLVFTATDADGTVDGYLITESATKPAAADPRWTARPPTQHVTSAVGSVILYAWAKDNKSDVSNSLSDTVTIPSSSINADTLDGIDSTGFATAVHSHDSEYQRKFANVVVVAKSGGDFTDPIAAVNSITQASETNRFLLKIMPGNYNLGTGSIFLPRYVDLEGSGQDTTWIISATAITGQIWENFGPASGSTLVVAGNARVSNLTVANNSDAGGIAIIVKGESEAVTRIENVTAVASGAGRPTYSDDYCGIYVRKGDEPLSTPPNAILSNVTAKVDSSSGGDLVAIAVFSGTAKIYHAHATTISNHPGNHAVGITYHVPAVDGEIFDSTIEVEVLGGGQGLEADNCSVRNVSVRASNGGIKATNAKITNCSVIVPGPALAVQGGLFFADCMIDGEIGSADRLTNCYDAMGVPIPNFP